MANSFTTWLGLTKPEVGAASNTWGGLLNGDMDQVDAVFANDGSGTPVGLKIGAATTASAAMVLMVAGIMTGTGAANMLGMASVDVDASTFGIHDHADTTRIVRISAAAINTGSTRTLTMPDADITAVGAANTQTISNKTLTAPVINSPAINSATIGPAGAAFAGASTGSTTLLAQATATGSVMLPAVATLDTLAALTATQTFTHKSMDGAANTFTNIPLTTAVTGVLPAANGGFPGVMTTNAISADVSINSLNTDFTGPTVAQGTTGTWMVWSTITLDFSTQGALVKVRLWDGTTVIDSTEIVAPGNAPGPLPVSLSGPLANPAGNIKMTVQCTNATNSIMRANASTYAKDSSLTAMRIG